MIRAHYEAQAAERRAAYDRQHGPGAAERHRAEALARPMPGPSLAPGYYGVGGHLSGSEYAAGGYRVGGWPSR